MCAAPPSNGTTSLLTDPSGGTLTNGAGEEMSPVLTNVLLAARPEPCRWLIRPDMPHGEAVRITLYFPYWNMLQYSALRVFDGATEQAPLLRSYVRNEFVLKHPLPVTSSGSELLVVYQGDTTSVGDGKFLGMNNKRSRSHAGPLLPLNELTRFLFCSAMDSVLQRHTGPHLRCRLWRHAHCEWPALWHLRGWSVHLQERLLRRRLRRATLQR